MFSVGLGGRECSGQHTVVPDAECARNGAKCPNCSLATKDETALLLQRLVSMTQVLVRILSSAKYTLILYNFLIDSGIIDDLHEISKQTSGLKVFLFLSLSFLSSS